MDAYAVHCPPPALAALDPADDGDDDAPSARAVGAEVLLLVADSDGDQAPLCARPLRAQGVPYVVVALAAPPPGGVLGAMLDPDTGLPSVAAVLQCGDLTLAITNADGTVSYRELWTPAQELALAGVLRVHGLRRLIVDVFPSYVASRGVTTRFWEQLGRPAGLPGTVTNRMSLEPAAAPYAQGATPGAAVRQRVFRYAATRDAAAATQGEVMAVFTETADNGTEVCPHSRPPRPPDVRGSCTGGLATAPGDLWASALPRLTTGF